MSENDNKETMTITGRRVFLPTLEESIAALSVASEVKDLFEKLVSTGKCDANVLITLGHELYELESSLLGGTEIYERWEDLQELKAHANECPELLDYCNYYAICNDDDNKVTMHHFNRDKEGNVE